MAKTTKQPKFWIVRNKRKEGRRYVGSYRLFMGDPPFRSCNKKEIYWEGLSGSFALYSFCPEKFELACPKGKLKPGEGPYPVEFHPKITKPRSKKGGR